MIDIKKLLCLFYAAGILAFSVIFVTAGPIEINKAMKECKVMKSYRFGPPGEMRIFWCDKQDNDLCDYALLVDYRAEGVFVAKTDCEFADAIFNCNENNDCAEYDRRIEEIQKD